MLKLFSLFKRLLGLRISLQLLSVKFCFLFTVRLFRVRKLLELHSKLVNPLLFYGKNRPHV